MRAIVVDTATTVTATTRPIPTAPPVAKHVDWHHPYLHPQSVGSIMIAVNPFQGLPIYGDDQIKLFRTKTKAEETNISPHVYTTAGTAYQVLSPSSGST